MKKVELKKQNLFIIGDIHGEYKFLKEMLKNVPKNTKIIFLGDLIDRGEDSLKTVQIVKELVNKGEAIAIKGNHEEMFLNVPEGGMFKEIYYENGGKETINNFLKNKVDKINLINVKETYDNIKKIRTEEYEFIKNMPYYVIMDDYLFIHAGVSPSYNSEEDFDVDDILWIREKFYLKKNKLNKRIFFGHTPVNYIVGYKDEIKKGIWHNYNLDKFGIDGGCGKEGPLFGVYLNLDEMLIENYQVSKKEKGIKSEKIKIIKLKKEND